MTLEVRRCAPKSLATITQIAGNSKSVERDFLPIISCIFPQREKTLPEKAWASKATNPRKSNTDVKGGTGGDASLCHHCQRSSKCDPGGVYCLSFIEVEHISFKLPSYYEDECTPLILFWDLERSFLSGRRGFQWTFRERPGVAEQNDHNRSVGIFSSFD